MSEHVDDPTQPRRIAMVVGAGGGMGAAVARRLATMDFDVHLVGRNEAALEHVAAELKGLGAHAWLHLVDVSEACHVRALMGGIGSRLDVVVHAAGESLMSSVDETTEEEWRQTLADNLDSAWWVSQLSLPLLRGSDNPTLILITSKTALKGYPVVAYSAAKAGVLGMARALASEVVPDRIRVVPVCPGPTDTPMRWRSTPDMDPALVMDLRAIEETVAYLVDLPRGATVDHVLVQAAPYD